MAAGWGTTLYVHAAFRACAQAVEKAGTTDWPEIAGVAPGAERLRAEIGDLPFAAGNLTRQLGVDAESSLRQSEAKSEGRFCKVDDALRDRAGASRTLRSTRWQRSGERRKRRRPLERTSQVVTGSHR